MSDVVEMTKGRFLEIVSLDTGEIARRVEVTGNSERQVERTMRGMLINLGDRWFVRDTADAADHEEADVLQHPFVRGVG